MKIATLRAATLAALAACSLLTATPAAADAISRQGFEFPAQGNVKIAVFRPDVRVGSMRIGGMDEANAEWTATARANMQAALEAEARAMNSSLVFIDDLEGEQAQLLT